MLGICPFSRCFDPLDTLESKKQSSLRTRCDGWQVCLMTVIVVCIITEAPILCVEYETGLVIDSGLASQ